MIWITVAVAASVVVAMLFLVFRASSSTPTDEYRRLAQDLLKAREAANGPLWSAEEEKLFAELTEQWRKLSASERVLFNGGMYHPTQMSGPYRTPDMTARHTAPEPPQPLPPTSDADKLLDNKAAYGIEYDGCHHVFLPSPSEPGYQRCKACGIRATEWFAAKTTKERAEENAEKERAAAFVQEHDKRS